MRSQPSLPPGLTPLAPRRYTAGRRADSGGGGALQQSLEALVQAKQTTEVSAAAAVAPKGIMGYGLYALVGVGVGVFSGLFGVGGGIIMVPFLIMVAKFEPKEANAI